jgi:hypothetical protein
MNWLASIIQSEPAPAQRSNGWNVRLNGGDQRPIDGPSSLFAPPMIGG